MKKILALILVSLALFSLSACGDESAKSGAVPTDSAAPKESIAPKESAAPEKQPNAAVQTKVEVKGDKIILSAFDGLGNDTVTEFVYKGGTLSDVTLTMKLPDTASAKKLCDSMKTGELKETAESAYSEFRQDGKNVICKLNDAMLAAYSVMSQKDLAELLKSTAAPLIG